MNEDEIFAERMLNLTIFREALTLYFRKFAETMTGMEFSAAEQSIRDWAKSREAV